MIRVARLKPSALEDDDWMAELLVQVDEELDAKLKEMGDPTASLSEPAVEPLSYASTKVSLLTLNLSFHVRLCLFATLSV